MFVIDDATIATTLTVLAIVGALAKCVGHVADAYHKVNPPKIPSPSSNRNSKLPALARNVAR